MVFPNYNEGLVNVISSIKKYYGIKTKHNSLKCLDDILKEKRSKNIVLVLFDGLGYNILKRNKRLCPTLNKYLVRSISSTFPSTTMTARTTIESGLNPIEHGWLGWDMYFKKFDKVITLSKNYTADKKEVITDYNIAKTFLKYKSVVSMVDEKEGFKGSKINVYMGSKKDSLKNAINKIKNICSNNSNNYIYLYIDEPDHTFHKAGVNSIRSKYKLFCLDRKFKKLCKSLDDTTIIALADHGHINVEYITLSNYPDIIKMLDGSPSIDKRACSFRVKKGYKNTFKKELKKILKDDFIILSSKEVDEQKLFGEGVKNKYYADALGDFFVISISNKSIRLNKKVHMHKSSHSGLTLDEMLVPLIIYKGESDE